MLNRIHAHFHNPSAGWDPITPEYAQCYGERVTADLEIVEAYEEFLGGFRSKRVVDVGSGPGHYALEFSRRGASVTCLDVSRCYLNMARDRLSAAGFDAVYALGYMDDICTATEGRFDGVFSNISWNYCRNDFSFTRALFKATLVGGVIMVRETNESFERNKRGLRVLQYGLNRFTGFKIGHPHPPHGRIARAFRDLPGCEVNVDYSDSAIDLVFVKRLR